MYYTIRGRAESIEDTSYQRVVNKGKADEHEETIQRYQLSLTIPGQQDLVKIDLSPERVADLPKMAQMEQWEMDETWLSATADSLRTAKGETDGRAWFLFTFSAIKVEEMSAAERKTLQDARKQVKTARKQQAADRRKAKQAEKTAQATTPQKPAA